MDPPRWQVEHLAALDTDIVAATEVVTAGVAHVGRVFDDLVGVIDLREVRARCPGLLAGPTPGLLLTLGLATRRLRGPLGEGVAGGRHRAVPRMPTRLMFELGDAGLEPGDDLTLGLDQIGHLALAGDHGLELCDPAFVDLDPRVVGHTTTFANQRAIPAPTPKNLEKPASGQVRHAWPGGHPGDVVRTGVRINVSGT